MEANLLLLYSHDTFKEQNETIPTMLYTSLMPMKNDFEISCAEEDGAVGGALVQTPNVTIRTAMKAGILNRMSWKNMTDIS